MVKDPEEEARAALRAYQEQAGMTFEDPEAPVAGTRQDDGIEDWMMRDERL